MNLAPLLPIFLTIFLAELGDKTQLAALLFSSKGEHSPWLIFLTATLALTVSTAIAVALGTLASKYVGMVPLKLMAGLGFIAIGGWTLLEHFKS